MSKHSEEKHGKTTEEKRKLNPTMLNKEMTFRNRKNSLAIDNRCIMCVNTDIHICKL